MSETLLLIDNRDVQALGGAMFERHNPLDGTVATRAAAATVADAIAAVDAARTAFPARAAPGPGAPCSSRPLTHSRRTRAISSPRWRRKPVRPGAGPGLTSSWPRACCGRLRR